MDFIRLRRHLRERADSGYHITEYWKSGPVPLTFMDTQYAVVRAIRADRLPAALIGDADGLEALVDRNHRLQSLSRRIFDAAEGGSPRPWRFLWVRPTYHYYRDEFYKDGEPTKYLVFSGWRFVPKAVSVILSARVRRALGEAEYEDATPFRFAAKRSFHLFDVCFPSVALASIIDVANLASEAGLTAHDVERKTRQALRQSLEQAGVEVGESGRDTVWRVVARLEAGLASQSGLSSALRETSVTAAEEAGAAQFAEHRDVFLGWLRHREVPLRLSETRFRRLARIAAWSPAVSLLRALWSVYPEARGRVTPGAMTTCLNALRNYWNRPLTQAIVTEHAREGRDESPYPSRILRYCRDAHVQAMLDEYAYLLRHVVQCTTVEDAASRIAQVLTLAVGSPKINVGRPRGRQTVSLAPEPVARRAHFALAFGEEATEAKDGAGEGGASERRTAVREAFNSPFFPFVLATTSVGQEGLDFHLYCRDIVHWNLPSNPVDLEQREGRINRRDGLALRRRIAREWPLNRVVRFARPGDQNPWLWVFQAIEESAGAERYKHGLYPHWVYEGSVTNGERLRRHLLFHSHSADVRRYAALKEGLALYRLVFGQPRQQDLVERLQRELADVEDVGDPVKLHARLSCYMINLSPMDRSHAGWLAEIDARRLLDEQDADRRRETLGALVLGTRRIQVERAEELAGVQADLEGLCTVAEGSWDGSEERQRVRWALRALFYVQNPYDRLFDVYPEEGLRDDVAVIRESARAIEQMGERPMRV
jgi:hypothetical protein